MKLTIITICYNNLIGLQKTIASIINQSSKDFQYIIIDGASNDGTPQYLSRIDFSPINHLIISEKDTGIYNAMNKGIKLSKGNYLLFLNSGDCLYDNDVVLKFNSNKITADIISGHTICENNGNFSHNWFAPDRITCNTFYSGSICHQSTFMKRTLFNNNLYDEANKICSDWQFFFKELIFGHASYAQINFFISRFDTTGISSTMDKDIVTEKNIEKRKVLESIMPRIFLEDYDHFIGERSYAEKKMLKLRENNSRILIIFSFIFKCWDKIFSNTLK
jgi:glycosyltransferase involved in cell wall biosynthesis